MRNLVALFILPVVLLACAGRQVASVPAPNLGGAQIAVVLDRSAEIRGATVRAGAEQALLDVGANVVPVEHARYQMRVSLTINNIGSVQRITAHARLSNLVGLKKEWVVAEGRGTGEYNIGIANLAGSSAARVRFSTHGVFTVESDAVEYAVITAVIDMARTLSTATSPFLKKGETP